MSKILIVEDEEDLAVQVCDWLTREHHTVEHVANGTEAVDHLAVSKYDVIILDWLLPGLDGIQVCRKYRSMGGKTPILMLTAKSTVEDKEIGLDSGADDYLAKPFHLKELSARVRALVRRTSTSSTTILEAGSIVLDPVARTVTKNGAAIHLERKEFNLLEFLMRNANKTFSAEALLDRVWESGSLASPDAIRTYIKSLRKKIDNPGEQSMITTVHGVGYKLESPDV
ncbi:MAG TPA: response regulator transcription factor [Candidatus Obscuribacterales bacterium]